MNKVAPLAALILFFFVEPDNAAASVLLDTLSTSVVYSKWVLMLVGVGLVMRAGMKAMNGENAAPAVWQAILTLIVPAAVISILEISIDSSSQTASGALAVNGRPHIEYMMAQAGLLTSSLISHWDIYSIVLVTVAYCAAAAVATKTAKCSDDNEKKKEWKQWAIPSAVIFGLFNPYFTVSSTNYAGELITQIGGSAQVEGGIVSPKGGSVMTIGDSAMDRIAGQKDLALIKTDGATDVPFVLSMVNQSMDELLGGISALIGRDAWLSYGMVNAKSSINRIQQEITNPDLAKRMTWFAEQCWVPALMIRNRDDPNIAARLARRATRAQVSLYNPFSPENLQVMKANPSMSDCLEVMKGNYIFDRAKYKWPLVQETLGNLAWQDRALKKEYLWQTVDEAVQAAPALQNKLWNRPDSSFYFSKTGEAMIADVFAKQGFKSTQKGTEKKLFASDNIVTSWASKLGMVAGTAMGNLTTAGTLEAMAMQLPVFMGFIQQVILTLWPFLLIVAIWPGNISYIPNALLGLLWAKSYCIPLALISNFDNWQGSAQLGLDEQLITTSAVAQMMLFSPVIMGAIIWKLAPTSASAGGGGR